MKYGRITLQRLKDIMAFLIAITIIMMTSTPALAKDPSWYEKKDTWLETMRAAREALASQAPVKADDIKAQTQLRNAREQLSNMLKRDFPEMLKDRLYKTEITTVWSADWKPGDFRELARRYVRACNATLTKEATTIAESTTSLTQLMQVREIYRKSMQFSDTIRRIESINIEAVGRAIFDMAKTWPDKYNATPHLKSLDEFKQKRDVLLQSLKESEPEALAEADKLANAVRSALLANPLLEFDKIILVRRGLSGHPGLPQNWQGNSSLPKKGYDNEIMSMSLKDPEAKLTTLYKPGDGGFAGDLCLHFNADRLLFSSIGTNGCYQVFEIGLDGKNLRQVTPNIDNDVDNYEGCYLPGGDILFSSTATFLGVPCVFGSSHIANFYRLDTRSGTIRQLTFEQEHDWSPVVLPNGRILYQRWEYTDAAHANSRMIFHMNPDGTDQRAYSRSGSFFPGSFFYARPLPGNPRHIIGIASGHHGVARAGRLLILDPAQGQRDGDGIVQEIPGYGKHTEPLVRDTLVNGVWPQFLTPFPLSEKYHIVSIMLQSDGLWGIYLADTFDNLTLIKEIEGSALLQPIAVQKTTEPITIPPRINLAIDTATAHIIDIHAGPGLEGVARGTVKRLRIYEYYFSHRGMGGLYGTLGFDGPWDIKRIIGTVPVEPDGSAYFIIPANTPLAIQPLDEKGQALQLMRSWLTAMPGENVSCIGCHESPIEAPITHSSSAARNKPSTIKSWYGPTRGFSFMREVQPVLNRYCTGCHGSKDLKTNDGNPIPNFKGDEMLTDWQTQQSGHWGGGGKFTKTYFELQRFVRRAGIEGDRRMFSSMDFHFSSTELGQILRKGHHGVQIDAESWERLTAWTDMNAPYYGTWGEIPPFDKQPHVKTVVGRAQEFRRKYVSMGPFPNYEEIPETPEYDSTPVKPSEIKNPWPTPSIGSGRQQLTTENASGWPFDTAVAVTKQKETVPSGTSGILNLSLADKKQTPIQCRYVRITAGPNRWMNFAEVQVFAGGQNIAVGKKATQSSTYGVCSASRAVDGNTDGEYAKNSLAHTGNGENEWWEVDLGAVTTIERLVIWNRTDCAMERLAGVTVSLFDVDRKEVWCKKTEKNPGRTVYLLNENPAFANLVWIPAGEFIMGSTAGHFDESPATLVKIKKGFWMSKVEISNAMYLQFNPKHESRNEDRHGYQFGITGYDQDQPDQPAIRISWEEAMAFCKWLSRKTGKKVTLPTEAQWEWACRAGTSSQFWYGDINTDFSLFANLGDKMLSYFAGNPYTQDWKAAAYKNPGKYDDWIPHDTRFNDGGFVTELVGKYKPNPWGLHDMHGNAWEWTRSTYKPYPYKDDDGRNQVEDVPAGTERVVRGGSWYDRPFRCTSSFRLPYRQFQRVYNVGFRIIVEED
ncbi:MAG: SUMF1/EgtB/PvdO family nonheme iron enzyme [Kiritimatiellae bacterium]|nr:SUMF1/EgtB/PvdO family nonheme iron enzyme [Kiritimatiellia bacterium]MDD5519883.1 SUMF1/EgtB/PvdO family nonheme iron enzyme [Kiritimatiellia bacterium]